MYLRWGTDDEIPGAHTEICVFSIGEGSCQIRIEEIPGSTVIELTVPTTDLAEFAGRLAGALKGETNE
jgi:hypothetical protein